MLIKTKRSILSGEIRIPASKSHTIRAVAIAGMAEGISILKNPLFSADTISCINAIKEFGAKIEKHEESNILKITGINGKILRNCFIDVGNSGTTLRILTAFAALSSSKISFDGDSSIRQRPMKPLFDALEKLGAKIESSNGKCPFNIQGPIHGGKTEVDAVSSQFLSALLFACPLINEDTEIKVLRLNEKPYVDITLDWLKYMEIEIENKNYEYFYIKGNQKYCAFEREIPADFSTATFHACAAAITGSELLLKGLDFKDHQGDKAVFDYLKKMGANIIHTDEGVKVIGNRLHGIDIDMNDTPDALPAMAVTACFAEGTTRLLNVPQARLKECDRIAASANELRKMGADIEELEDGLIIKGGKKLKGTVLHGYHDHRMVMALAIAGMAAEGETIVDTAESASVTYPKFVEDMKRLGANIELFEEK